MADGLKIVVDAEVKPAEQAIVHLGDTIKNRLGGSAANSFGKGLNEGLVKPLGKIPNASNQATLSMINLGRVVQDAPFGFLGIANNLNPLLESFQRLKQSTGTTGGALKALGSSLMGAGGLGFALSIVSTGLILFGDALFGSKKRADDSKAALDELNDSIIRVKTNTESLTNALSFQNKLGALNLKIIGFGDIEDLKQQSIAQQQFVFDIGNQILKAQKNLSDAQALNAKEGTDKTKEIEEKAFNELQDLRKKDIEARQAQTIIYRQISLQKITDQKDFQEKSKAALEKYQREIIALAEKIKFVPFFGSFEENEFATLQQNFVKAKALVDAFFNLTTQKKSALTAPVRVDIEKPEQHTIDTFTESLSKLFKEPVTVPMAFSISEIIDPFKVQRLTKIADTVSGVLTPAFQGLFDAIASGQSPIRAFFAALGQSIQGLISQLIQAAIKALVLKLILSASGVGGAASGIGGLFGSLAGGINSRGGVPGVGGGLAGRSSVVVQGSFRLRGADAILQLNRENRRQQTG
jgi:hypothetical protein